MDQFLQLTGQFRSCNIVILSKTYAISALLADRILRYNVHHMAKQTQTAPKVGFVSLGCAKALVDSERILTQLRAEGYEFAPDYGGADVVIVNTCGFLDSAREESLAAIGEALAENGKVIVTGCMGATPDLIRKV